MTDDNETGRDRLDRAYRGAWQKAQMVAGGLAFWFADAGTSAELDARMVEASEMVRALMIDLGRSAPPGSELARQETIAAGYHRRAAEGRSDLETETPDGYYLTRRQLSIIRGILLAATNPDTARPGLDADALAAAAVAYIGPVAASEIQGVLEVVLRAPNVRDTAGHGAAEVVPKTLEEPGLGGYTPGPRSGGVGYPWRPGYTGTLTDRPAVRPPGTAGNER